MNKFTPGPWHRIDGDRNVYSASGAICKNPVILCGGSAARNWEANARLIASAPDLLEALDLMVTTHDEGGWPSATIVIARAAIARARGESQ
jgi:hypothetical protein